MSAMLLTNSAGATPGVGAKFASFGTWTSIAYRPGGTGRSLSPSRIVLGIVKSQPFQMRTSR